MLGAGTAPVGHRLVARDEGGVMLSAIKGILHI
ncbi:MAG: hypothetical protein ACFWT5_06120 [Pseudomonas helleri]|jgi:hypothetical protein